MIHATIPLSHFTALDDAMMRAGKTQRHADNEVLWMHCAFTMGADWCQDYETAPECAAMIVAMALLKQIEIVEDV